MADDTKVVGKALYMEFRKASSTYQVILTPDGITNEGKNIPAMIYRRQISEAKPRRAWKNYSLPAASVSEFGAFPIMPVDMAADVAVKRLEFASGLFNQLQSYHFELYKTPLFIEVSQADLLEVRAGKTPYKILGRITRVRKALGFSDKLFA